MTQPTKKTNGNKTRAEVVCPHIEACNAPARQEELMRSLDDMSTSIQMLIQRVEQIHTEHLERAKIYIDCNARILDELRGLRGEVDGA